MLSSWTTCPPIRHFVELKLARIKNRFQKDTKKHLKLTALNLQGRISIIISKKNVEPPAQRQLEFARLKNRFHKDTKKHLNLTALNLQGQISIIIFKTNAVKDDKGRKGPTSGLTHGTSTIDYFFDALSSLFFC